MSRLSPRARYLPATCTCAPLQQDVCVRAVRETISVGTLVLVFEDRWLSPLPAPAELCPD